MKIGQVTINKIKKNALLIQLHLCRLIILFSLRNPWKWKFGRGSFTEMVREPGDILINERASYMNIGPFFFMYTRPNAS